MDASRLDNRGLQGPIDVMVDSTGLTVCGQGEWHDRKHGEKKRQRCKKRHIGVDSQSWIIASRLIESREQNPSQVPALLTEVEREIERFIGEGDFVAGPSGFRVERGN